MHYSLAPVSVNGRVMVSEGTMGHYLLRFDIFYHYILRSFNYHGLTLIPVWISNYIHCIVWGEITYAFLNFNGATVEV